MTEYHDKKIRDSRKRLDSQLKQRLGEAWFHERAHEFHAIRCKKQIGVYRWAQIILSIADLGFFVSFLSYGFGVLIILGVCSSFLLLLINVYFKNGNLEERKAQHMISAKEFSGIKEVYLKVLNDFDLLDEAELFSERDRLQAILSELHKREPEIGKSVAAKIKKGWGTEKPEAYSETDIRWLLPEFEGSKQEI